MLSFNGLIPTFHRLFAKSNLNPPTSVRPPCPESTYAQTQSTGKVRCKGAQIFIRWVGPDLNPVTVFEWSAERVKNTIR